jgi:hypothetical protein
MTKKLFAVEVTYKAYAWAEDKFDAESLVSEIVDSESYPDIEVDEVYSNVLGWDLACCIYHEGGGDIQLRDVLFTSQAPTREENLND